MITGVDSCSIVNDVAGTVNCNIGGPAVFDFVTGRLTFDSGVAWASDSAGQTTAAAPVTTAAPAVTVAPTTTTAGPTTTVNPNCPAGLDCRNLEGTFSDGAGNTIEIVDNGDGTFQAVTVNAAGVVVAADTASAFDSITGSVTFTTNGAGTFVDGVLTFVDGAVWTKTAEVPEEPTTTLVTTTEATLATTTVGEATAEPPTAMEMGLVGTFVNNSGSTVEISANPDGTFTAIFRNTDGVITGFDTGTITDPATGAMNWNSAGAATIDAQGNINFAADAWVKAASTTTAAGTVPYGGSGTTAAGAPAAATTAAYNGAGGGATQAPYNGGGATQAPYNGNAVGAIQGDPHVRIQAKGEEPICYDIEGEAMDFVSLFDDRELDLEINGFLEHIKGGKNRLAKIGIQTNSGIQIGIDDNQVAIGIDGEVQDIYDFRSDNYNTSRLD